MTKKNQILPDVWKQLWLDDPGGKWCRRLPEGKRFLFIEFDDMNDACGKDNEGLDKYCAALSYVDVDAIPNHELAQALRSAGYTPEFPLEDDDLRRVNWEAVAEACHSYGLKAPLGEWSGGSWHNVVRAAAQEGVRLLRDETRLAEKLDRPVNLVGSTAREVMVGDFESGITRGKAEGNPHALIVGKMEDACRCQTCGTVQRLGSGCDCPKEVRQ